MSAFRDITGQKFNRLTAIEVAERKGCYTMWRFICDCGQEKVARVSHVTSGAIASCGCYQKERQTESATKHGMSNTRIWRIWMLMHQRCRNPNSTPYPWYGAKGIKVCDAWKTFEQFYADVGDPPSESHSIDRINPYGDYEPNNVRWATPKQQRQNTRENYHAPATG